MAESTRHVQGVLGRKAALPCDIQPHVADDHATAVLWFKESDDRPVYSYDVRDGLASQPKRWSSPAVFGKRAFFRAVTRPAELTVDAVTPADAGIYRCRVDFRLAPTRNYFLNFTVITPPKRPTIVDTRTNDQIRLLQPYNEGDTLNFTCETSGGDPSPWVTWYLDSILIDDSYEQRADGVTVNTLTLHVGREHFNARLVCRAANNKLAPPQTKLLILNINLRPLTVNISKEEQLRADREYDLVCKTKGSWPAAVATWWLDGRQIKEGVTDYFEPFVTFSVLHFVPVAEDDEATLVCRAQNPRIQDAVIEDKMKLDVLHVPVVTLWMGSRLNPGNIKEGDDVYFECSVKANPKGHRLTWYKGDQEISHNASSGVILGNQSLLLQNVNRTAAGNYSCMAVNSIGSASSNPASLQVRYAPVCKILEDGKVYGALKMETVMLHCSVDSNPAPRSFTWTFNSSGEQSQLATALYTKTFESVIRYTPTADGDFGMVACFATNSVGRQQSPCLFEVVAVDKPMPLQNCSVFNQSAAGLQVECLEGFDGGLPQIFFMEVLKLPSLLVQANVTSNHSAYFDVELDGRSTYVLKIYAANAKGRSEAVTIYTVALKISGWSTSLLLCAMLVALSALLCAAVGGVITALYRRHLTRRHDSDNDPSSANDLYIRISIESLPNPDSLNTYTATPKHDHCSQYELKMDDVEETDLDIIHSESMNRGVSRSADNSVVTICRRPLESFI